MNLPAHPNNFMQRHTHKHQVTMPPPNNDPTIPPDSNRPSGPTANTRGLLQQFDTALERRRQKTDHLSDEQRQELRRRLGEAWSNPDQAGWAEHIKWTYETGAYLAVAGNFDEFCLEFLSCPKDEVLAWINPAAGATGEPVKPAATEEPSGNGGVTKPPTNSPDPASARPAGKAPPRKRKAATAPVLPADGAAPVVQGTSAKETHTIKVGTLCRLPELAIRKELCKAAITDYADRASRGEQCPPVLVYDIDGKLVLVDGHHRVAALEKLGKTSVTAIVVKGTLEEAFEAAIHANQSHGVRLTNRDKHVIVSQALQLFREDSDGVLAAKCGVSDRFVARVRQSGANGSPLTRKGRDGKTYKVAPTQAEQSATGTAAPSPESGKTEPTIPAFMAAVKSLFGMAREICDAHPNYRAALVATLRRAVKEFAAPKATKPAGGVPPTVGLPKDRLPPIGSQEGLVVIEHKAPSREVTR